MLETELSGRSPLDGTVEVGINDENEQRRNTTMVKLILSLFSEIL